jgi:putative membrane protein
MTPSVSARWGRGQPPRMSRPLLFLTAAACAAATLVTASVATAHPARHHARFSAWDEEWLMTSIMGDRFEIAGGNLAQSQSSNAQIKALGARLVKDHTDSLKSAIKLAHRLRIEVPKTPSPSQQWELKVLGRMSGAPFDKNYADLEVFDHRQDIQESRDEVKLGSNRKVRKEAKTDLPVLKKHLKLSKAALAAVGGNG